MNLEDRLKQLREQHHYTQDDVAEFLNKSRQSVSKWELGKGYPDTENLIRFRDLYEISLDKLIRGEEKYQKNSHNNSNQKSVGDFLWNYWWLIFPVLAMIFFRS